MGKKDHTRTEKESQTELDRVLSKAFKQSFASNTVFASEKTFLNYVVAIIAGMILGSLTNFLNRFITIFGFLGFLVFEQLVFWCIFRKDERQLEELENMFNEKGEKHA